MIRRLAVVGCCITYRIFSFLSLAVALGIAYRGIAYRINDHSLFRIFEHASHRSARDTAVIPLHFLEWNTTSCVSGSLHI